MDTVWYSQIEEPIRGLVKVLRDNGVNTTWSCGHKMAVEATIIPDGQLHTIHKAVYDFLAEENKELDYNIDIHMAVNRGHTIACSAKIILNEKEYP